MGGIVIIIFKNQNLVKTNGRSNVMLEYLRFVAKSRVFVTKTKEICRVAQQWVKVQHICARLHICGLVFYI